MIVRDEVYKGRRIIMGIPNVDASRIERYELTSNYEDQMSDFKVGDVVRVDNNPIYYEYAGRKGKVERVASWVHVRFSDIEAAPYSPHSLSLVSRPSEAKPKRDCNLSCAHLAFFTQAAHDSWHRDNDPKPPAFKVGDRVRFLPYQPGMEWQGDSVQRTLAGRTGVLTRCGDMRNDCWYVRDDETREESKHSFAVERLEPLPPTTAKPMTATAVSILYENGNHGADGMTREQVESLRQHIYATNPTIRNWLGELVPAAKAPSNGWLPAGTYMPLKERSIETIKLCPKFRMAEGKLDPTEQGKGIVKSIPSYERRFSSRTVAWDPVDDTFLEDA